MATGKQRLTKILALVLLVAMLSACVAPDGERYVVVHENAIEQAQYNGAFAMCLGLVARDLDPVLPASPENVAGVLQYCVEQVIDMYGAEPTPEPEPSGNEL